MLLIAAGASPTCSTWATDVTPAWPLVVPGAGVSGEVEDRSGHELWIVEHGDVSDCRRRDELGAWDRGAKRGAVKTPSIRSSVP